MATLEDWAAYFARQERRQREQLFYRDDVTDLLTRIRPLLQQAGWEIEAVQVALLNRAIQDGRVNLARREAGLA